MARSPSALITVSTSRNLENYIKRLEALEEITSSFNGVEKSFAIQAGREVRIMIKPEVTKPDQKDPSCSQLGYGTGGISYGKIKKPGDPTGRACWCCPCAQCTV